jgi:DNA-binding transcriptional MerR regulator
VKFSIGEFSIITSLSIKSLRLYHEKGILIPAEVDEFTGYRYYNEVNFDTAGSVKTLKEYGFTLADIKEILDGCNEESEMLEQLQKKLDETKQMISRYSEISRSIENIIKYEREIAMKEEQQFEIEEKEVETILIAGHRMKGKYSEIGEGFKLLTGLLGRHINGKAMCLHYDTEFKDDGADFEPCFPVRKGKSNDNISVRELPGGNCVSIIHKGTYGQLSNSYKKIFGYIIDKGYKSKIPSREVYVKGPGMIFKGNPNNYLTEIQLFID